MSSFKRSEKYRLAERMRLLADWYGADIAGTEMAAHTSPPIPVRDAVREISEKLFSPDLARQIRIQQNWKEIAGSQLAALLDVATFENQTLTLTVRHNAFLRELAGTEELLLPRLNTFLANPDACRHIEITALTTPGGYRRRRQQS